MVPFGLGQALYNRSRQTLWRFVEVEKNVPVNRPVFPGFALLGAAATLLLTGYTAPQAATPVECKLPQPAEGAEFVLASSHPSSPLSSVALGSQNVVTYVREVRIDREAGPLYVVVLAPVPTVWKVDAQDHDLDRLIVAGPAAQGATLAGVSGLPPEKVTFVPLEACGLGLASRDRRSLDDARRALTSQLGRPPDHTFTIGSGGDRFVLGRSDRKADEGSDLESWYESDPRAAAWRQRQATKQSYDFADELQAEFRFRFPGGVRELRPEEILSPVAVERYELLPKAPGLLQLVEAGALRRMSPAEARAWQEGASRRYRFRLSPDFRYRPRNWPPRFVVTREIRLPLGFVGSLRSSFLVPEGVPQPEGNLGHDCLFLMEGFRVWPNSCAGEAFMARQAILSLPPDIAGNCRALEPGSDVHIAALSVHSARTRPSGSGRGRKARFDIQVNRLGRTLLVISGYNSAEWRVRFGYGTVIAGVIALAHDEEQVITGLPRTVPILHILKDQMHDRRRCSPGSAPLSAHRGGPFALALNVYVERLTGREIDWLGGPDSTGRFLVP